MILNKSEIDELVATRIAPIVRVDGGDVEVAEVDLEECRVALRFGGSYRGNPCRGVVLEHVVRPILQECFDNLEKIEIAD
jgi:Fe-S cluster biogenesis protein NfuA